MKILCWTHSYVLQVEQSDGHVALVTTNDGRFFSNGLDLAWLQKNPTQLLVNGLTVLLFINKNSS